LSGTGYLKIPFFQVFYPFFDEKALEMFNGDSDFSRKKTCIKYLHNINRPLDLP